MALMKADVKDIRLDFSMGESEKLFQDGPADALSRLITVLEPFANEFKLEIGRLTELRERLQEGRFHLAVLGQFKRGKSTLLNALLGESLLPTSVVPLTAIPTFLHAGNAARVKVSFLNNDRTEEYAGGSTEERKQFLERFVTEECNPKNHLGVSQVDVFLPSPFLAKGVVLIDTPGIGSTYRHNTEATLNFLPQCDAALFLISADPPITQAEIEFLREVRDRVPRLFFVLNKIDYLSRQDQTKALEFLNRTLLEQFESKEKAPIFAISARQGLEARQANDSHLWTQSGLEHLEKHLIDFLANEKMLALEEAVSRKACDALESIRMHLQLSIRSLELPQEEIEQRLATFDIELAHAYRERQIAQDLLAGDQRRCKEFLEVQSKQLRREARESLEKALRSAPDVFLQGTINETAAQEVMAAAIPVFFEKKLGAMAKQMDKHVSDILTPYQMRIDDLVERIRRAAAEIFEVPYHPLGGETSFTFQRQPFWVTHKWYSSFSPFPENWLDRFLPAPLRQQRAMKRLSRMVEDLVMHNVENLRWATLQNIDRAFMRFSSRLDECLEETIAGTKGAIQAAVVKREQQTEHIAEEVARLGKAIQSLEMMKTALSRWSKVSKPDNATVCEEQGERK